MNTLVPLNRACKGDGGSSSNTRTGLGGNTQPITKSGDAVTVTLCYKCQFAFVRHHKETFAKHTLWMVQCIGDGEVSQRFRVDWFTLLNKRTTGVSVTHGVGVRGCVDVERCTCYIICSSIALVVCTRK